MRKLFVILIAIFQLLCCLSVKGQKSRKRDIAGIYYLKSDWKSHTNLTHAGKVF